MKKTIIIIIVLLCVVAGVYFFTSQQNNPTFESAYSDEITVSEPVPNAQVKSPLSVSGKARGTWFFEASFPAEITDSHGKSLGGGVMQAEGEWMTEEFVQFNGEIAFEKPETAEGILILRNDNPSGLPENQKEVQIPIKF